MYQKGDCSRVKKLPKTAAYPSTLKLSKDQLLLDPCKDEKKNRVGIKPRTFGGTEYGTVLYSLIDYSINFPCQRASFIDISLQ